MSITFSNIVTNLFSIVDQMLNNFVYSGYNTLVDHLKYPLGLAVTLYIAIFGFSSAFGYIQLSMSTIMKSSIKIALIYMFALQWGNFSEYFINGIEGSAGQIGNWLVTASPIPLPHDGGGGINGALQSVFNEVTNVGVWIWDKATFENWSPLLEAIGSWIFGYMALVLAIVEILLAKIMLAVFFTIAPLTISLTLFKTTHGMFDRWLGAILGYALFLIMIPAALALGLSLDQWVLQGQVANQGHDITMVDWVPLMVVGFLNLAIIKNITNYAKSIGGSIGIQSGSSMLAGTIGGFIGGAMSTIATPNKIKKWYRERKNSQA